jgi:superfamily II DNA/RNA helicase
MDSLTSPRASLHGRVTDAFSIQRLSLNIAESAPASFAALGLRDEVLRAVAEAGYTQPTPIQAAAIPHVLARRDIIGIAQTGTGKTASFVLPMLDILASGRARARMPRSIILSPTRELATQTSANFESYGKHLSLTMALIIGGVGMGDQEKLLEKGVDVLIATPGRLLDWFERGKVILSHVQILVIDEADRMLDMGFIPDVERIIGLLLKREQTLLFSATMPPEVRRLADRFLKDPAVVQITRSATPAADIEDRLVAVPAERKRDELAHLIAREGIGKAIVFCNRKREVDGLTRWLKRKGLNARDIHGDLEQAQRQAALDAFKADAVDLLIATDVAGRGLDIDDMPCVINFDVPMHAEDYVHRIGRTGRAGRKGRAFTLMAPADDRYVAAIERLMGRAIPRLAAAPDGAAAPPPAEPARERRPAARVRRERTAAVQAPRPAPVEPPRAPAPPPPAARHEPEVEAALRKGQRGATPRPEPREEALAFGERADLPLFLQRPVPERLLGKTKEARCRPSS